MSSVSGKLTSQDQVIEKYYYCLHLDPVEKKIKRNYCIASVFFIFFAAAYFYLRGVSSLFALVFLPLVIAGYYLSPWFYWKYSVDTLWKKLYVEYDRVFTIGTDNLIVVSKMADGQDNEIRINSPDVRKVLYNRKHMILFFFDSVSLINIESESEKAVQEVINQLKQTCARAVIQQTKVKANLL